LDNFFFLPPPLIGFSISKRVDPLGVLLSGESGESGNVLLINPGSSESDLL